MEDFEYLFGIVEENHPYLVLKARTEGYNWLSHRQEFEQAVKAAADDRAFAQAIAWMLRQINNGHTNIVRIDAAQSMAQWNEKPWGDAVRRNFTTTGTTCQ